MDRRSLSGRFSTTSSLLIFGDSRLQRLAARYLISIGIGRCPKPFLTTLRNRNLRARLALATVFFAVIAVAVCVRLRPSGAPRQELDLGDAGHAGRHATIRAKVTGEAILRGRELVNATASHEVLADPGWVVSLRVEKCIRGRIDCEQLEVLVGHSPSAELGAQRLGQLIVLSVSATTKPTTLCFKPDDPLGRSHPPDLSGIRYVVNPE